MVLESKTNDEIYLRHVISLILILMNEYVRYKNPLFKQYEPYAMNAYIQLVYNYLFDFHFNSSIHTTEKSIYRFSCSMR